MSLSLRIAVAALVLSALSPIATLVVGLFTHRMDIKECQRQRNYEFYESHRADVIERYISAASIAVNPNTTTKPETAISDFNQASGEVYLYINKSYWPKLDELWENINANNAQGDIEAKKQLRELCKVLSYEKVRTEYEVKPNYREKGVPRHKPPE